MRWTRGSGQCRHCGRAIKPGQIALIQSMPNNPITDRELRYHKSCIQQIIDTCPPDIQEQSFNELKQRIAVTGLAFPD